MHFDDRLATVLRLPASGGAMARIQFRQLLDLLGRKPDQETASHSATRDAAFARLEALGAMIGADERARMLHEPMVQLANPDLVAQLAATEPYVASAAIRAADLEEADWLELIPALPVRARGILRHRRDLGPKVERLLERLGIGDRALPPVTAPAPPSVQPRNAAAGRPELVVIPGAGQAPAAEAGSGIGAIVRRIEAFRKAREELAGSDRDGAASDGTGIPTGAEVFALDFMTDGEGRVAWAEGHVGPALVGCSLKELEADEAEISLRSAIRLRQPLDGVTLSLPLGPLLAGKWRLDAVPFFDNAGGHFVGYIGRLRRQSSLLAAADAQAAEEVDRMRQVLHELRTPANAIQVAAEIIQQQLYGPAPHEYRALAAGIAGDTAQILAGFEELDRLVKLESGTLALSVGESDLAGVVTRTAAQLQAWAAPRGSGLRLPEEAPDLPVAIAEDDLARMIWRLLAALAGGSEQGEVLDLKLEQTYDSVLLWVDLPQAWARQDATPADHASLGDATRSLSGGIFGVGFTLRLAAAEAKAAGGALTRSATALHLRLPRLTRQAASHTQVAQVLS